MIDEQSKKDSKVSNYYMIVMLLSLLIVYLSQHIVFIETIFGILCICSGLICVEYNRRAIYHPYLRQLNNKENIVEFLEKNNNI